MKVDQVEDISRVERETVSLMYACPLIQYSFLLEVQQVDLCLFYCVYECLPACM